MAFFQSRCFWNLIHCSLIIGLVLAIFLDQKIKAEVRYVQSMYPMAIVFYASNWDGMEMDLESGAGIEVVSRFGFTRI